MWWGGFCGVVLCWFGLGWVGLGWVGLGWVGFWFGLGWVGLGWVRYRGRFAIPMVGYTLPYQRCRHCFQGLLGHCAACLPNQPTNQPGRVEQSRAENGGTHQRGAGTHRMQYMRAHERTRAQIHAAVIAHAKARTQMAGAVATSDARFEHTPARNYLLADEA